MRDLRLDLAAVTALGSKPRGGVAVRELACTDTWYLARRGNPVIETRRGETPGGLDVFATVAGPTRWFVVQRGFDVPEGLWGEIVWEVDGSTDAGGLDRRAHGDRRAAEVTAGHLDLAFCRERADAERLAASRDIDISDEPTRNP